MQPVPDPYRVLGVAHSATIAQVKAAHRALAKRYHPDAPDGDTARFLAVQNAYLLLSDPARRRQWDAAHAPGPVRAGENVPRGRARGAAGRWTREEPDTGARRSSRAGTRRRTAPPPAAPERRGADPAAEPGPTDPRDEAPPGTSAWSASGRDPASRSHTWSAKAVPWWEDFPGSRDRPTRRAAEGRPAAGFRTASLRPDRSRTSRDEGEGAHEARRSEPHEPAPADATAGAVPTHEPDVYSRSSGAAWSSAARRYFRRSDSELPSRGSFRKQGTQYVTGARAREMADGGWTSGPSAGDDRVEQMLRPHPDRPSARQAFEHEPAGTVRAHRPVRRPLPRPASEVGATPDLARGGIGARPVPSAAGTSATVSRGSRTMPPDIGQRAAEVALAWLPMAGLAALGPPAALGCGSAAEACPQVLLPAQALVAAIALAAVVAFPRLARIAAVATAGGFAVALLLLLILVSVGLLPPAPPIVAGMAVLIGAGYVAAGSLAATFMWRDHRGHRPRSRSAP